MAKILDKQRYTCALGAINTIHAINRVIPVLHSGPGCAGKLTGGGGSSGLYSPNIYPCSSVSEKEVVFGGERKLHDTIENALKVIEADLYVVVSGCTSEIVGDDIVGTARISTETPGNAGVNLRSEPSTYSNGLGVIAEGTLIRYTNRTEKGYTYCLVNGTYGWILTQYIVF